MEFSSRAYHVNDGEKVDLKSSFPTVQAQSLERSHGLERGCVEDQCGEPSSMVDRHVDRLDVGRLLRGITADDVQLFRIVSLEQL